MTSVCRCVRSSFFERKVELTTNILERSRPYKFPVRAVLTEEVHVNSFLEQTLGEQLGVSVLRFTQVVGMSAKNSLSSPSNSATRR